MPKRTDIKRVLVIGSGPIVIGLAAEFDYSGTQAVKALRSEGLEVVLVNSNPATIMTDPETADRTYVEPLTVESVAAIIRRERPDALLPTVGGQTALNLAMALDDAGVLAECGVEMIGAKGGGTAFNPEEFEEIVRAGLAASPIQQVLIEESILGWKEFELEVMRDLADNVVIICPIENFDPMGVHTGDSITVAPAQTLTDREYQSMRDMAIRVIRKVGVETGGSNIQFGVNPDNGDIRIIEMNPRVSRSSALASKATGFPIAKMAAKLAVGYTLDEIPNDITRVTPASFEPTIDYVVTKIPRWAFEKFPTSPGVLGTSMQSVGEAMAIGRTFPESLQKALRSLEVGRAGLNCDPGEAALDELADDELLARAAIGTPDRPFQLEAALRRGITVEALADRTKVDPWFLDQILRIVEEREHLAAAELAAMGRRDWRRGQRARLSHAPPARAWGADPPPGRRPRVA